MATSLRQARRADRSHLLSLSLGAAACCLAASLPAAVGRGMQQPATQQPGSQQPGTQQPQTTEERLQEFERELQELRDHIGVTTVPREMWPIPVYDPRENYMEIPGTGLEIRLGGFVKLDLLHDFYAIGDPDKFATKTIEVPRRRVDRTQLLARQSRLGIDIRGNYDDEELRMFIEGDFLGSKGAFRLRHAFGRYGGWMAGQTWSTFMDISVRPPTRDIEGPDAEIFLRTPQVRYSHDWGGGITTAAAIEDPSTDITLVSGVTGEGNTSWPDFAANIRWQGEGSHLQLSGIAQSVEFEGSMGFGNERAVGWGFALSGRTNLQPGTRVTFQVNGGEGYSRFIHAFAGTGSDGVVRADGSLELLPAWGGFVGVVHDWTPKLSSALVYSRTKLDNDSAQATDAIQMTQAASINLLYRPAPRVLTSIEYLVGMRENFDGQDGVAHRIGISFQYSF